MKSAVCVRATAQIGLHAGKQTFRVFFFPAMLDINVDLHFFFFPRVYSFQHTYLRNDDDFGVGDLSRKLIPPPNGSRYILKRIDLNIFNRQPIF